MDRRESVLSARDRARLAEAFGLLQRGRAREATDIAVEIASRMPESPDVLHMLALCRKATGDVPGALAAFEAALARAPRDAKLLGNCANLLGRTGRREEAIALYRRALEVSPADADARLNLGLTLLDAGAVSAARDVLEEAVRGNAGSSRAWQGLGSVRRAAGDLAGAEAALRRAVSLTPGAAAAWVNLGVTRRLLGDPGEALQCHAEARKAGFAGPELEDAEASAHLDLGDPARALQIVRGIVAKAPDYVPAHRMLADILWEYGAALAPGEDPLTAFRAAAVSRPGNRVLGRAFLRFLLESKAGEEALRQARSMRAQSDEPDLVAMEAQALDLLGEQASAGQLFARVFPVLGKQAAFVNFYIRHLIKAGQPDAAAARALEILQREPENQPALAWLGIAWRLLGDAREEWLCGYDRLVAEMNIEAPPEFADEKAFLAALRTCLEAMHAARREPVNQSLRGGSQTSGVLFGRREPVIVALREAMARSVQRYVDRLPDDPSHPFLRRKSPGIRFQGSWSVRLWSSGSHVNHIHQEGWISSACYICLPPAVAQPGPGSTAGFLQFGGPPADLGLDLPVRRQIRPRVGRLVLFPSYLWHGTVPFVDDLPRLTVAFDAVPAGGAA